MTKEELKAYIDKVFQELKDYVDKNYQKEDKKN